MLSIRWFTRLFLAVAITLAPVGVAVPASADPSGTLDLKSLSFDSNYVDVRDEWKAVALRFTVRDTDAAAEQVRGHVELRMIGEMPDSYVGQTYKIDFEYGERWFTRAQFVSGTPQESTYEYYFPVPRYNRISYARWVVTKFVATDDRGASVTVRGTDLTPYHGELNVTTLIDSTGPSTSWYYLEPISDARPYAYVKDRTFTLSYYAYIQDPGAGFWKGSLRLTGPGGQTVNGDFEAVWFQGDDRCGGYSGGDVNYVSCQILVRIPAGAPSGTWRASELVLTDNIGNTTSITELDTPPITVTSNEVVSASEFTVAPNPVNNWRQGVTTQVSMKVTGAAGGVGAVHMDLGPFHGCRQLTTTPTAGPDGTVTIPVRVDQGVSECSVTGLVVVDGAGNVALYGSRYGAPDPGLTIRRLPNTVPPTVTEATLTPTTVARSQAGSTWPVLTLKVTAPIAPVTGYDLYLYDEAGNIAAQQGGGTGVGADGYLRIYGYLPYGIAPGVYTYGLRIDDASRLSSWYGPPNGQPMPNGPLQLTVTDN